MKLSKFNMKKINIKDIKEEYSVQDILTKIGELYQFESGIYAYGNIWTKLERIIENIIIEELDKADCIQVEFPKLQSKKIWEQSNRWDMYTKDSDIMFTLNNNLGEYGLAPTAEECATLFGANRLISHKNLPAIYYQISEKFRKEIRPRGYIFRTRAFQMLDAYSFDKNEEDMKNTYKKMYQVYLNIFKRLGIDIIPTIADNGVIGGSLSHEWQAPFLLGEDITLYDKNNNIGLNSEVLEYENKEEYLNKLGIETNNLNQYKTTELGHTFQLGTKYSENMKLFYIDEQGKQKPYYMGCYGIGMGRLIATILENNIIKKNNIIQGFSIPENIAPYKIQIIYKENKEKEAFDIYNKLLEKGINCIIDDRQNYTLGNKIKDTYLLGTPYFIIIGDNYDNNNLEIEETKNNVKLKLSLNEFILKLTNK